MAFRKSVETKILKPSVRKIYKISVVPRNLDYEWIFFSQRLAQNWIFCEFFFVFLACRLTGKGQSFRISWRILYCIYHKCWLKKQDLNRNALTAKTGLIVCLFVGFFSQFTARVWLGNVSPLPAWEDRMNFTCCSLAHGNYHRMLAVVICWKNLTVLKIITQQILRNQP